MFHKKLKMQLAILMAISFFAVVSSRSAAGQTVNPNPLSCSGYPEPRIFLETHAWFTSSSQVPGADSAQVRLGTCFPYKQTLTGKVTLDIRVTMHNNPGTLTVVDGYIAHKSGTTLVYKVPTTFTCLNPGTCEKWFRVVADTTLVPYDGRQEFRLRANVNMPDGKRLLATSGWQAHLKNGKVILDFRTGDVSDGLGSVDTVGTTIARQGTDIPTAPVSGVWNFNVSALQGYNGSPVATHSILVDPDYNNQTSAMELKVGPAPLSNYTLSLATTSLPDGEHKLGIRADAQSSGNTGTSVMVVPFVVRNGSIAPVKVTTTSLPTAITATSYSAALSASGGTPPYKWSIASGQLPSGISLSTNGMLLGTASTVGTYTVQVVATDSASTPQKGSATLTLPVVASSAPAPLAVVAQTLPGGTVGSSYSATLTASGGVPPYTWNIATGALPSGLALNSNGTLSGIPDASGTFSFTAKAADAAGTTASRTFSMVVASSPVTSSGGSAGQMFITKAELNSKPTSGAGWNYLKSKADLSWTNITIGDQNSYTQTYVLAAALIYARDPVTYASYRDKVITAIKKVPGTEANANQLLAVARTLFGYVVSADLVGMPQSTVCNNGETWLHFLQRIRTQTIPGNSSMTTLEGTSLKYANNWAAHALSSHLAVSYALNDSAGIQRDLNIVRRDLGDTTSPIPPFTPDASYNYNSDGATWDMTRTMQRGINPYSATDARQGMIIEDGLRFTSGGSDSVRCCTVQPAGRGYMSEHLDGLMATIQLFRAHGVDLRSSQDSALKRAFDFYQRNGGLEYSTEQVLPYVINYFYGTHYSTVTETTVERKLGYGAWLFTGPTP